MSATNFSSLTNLESQCCLNEIKDEVYSFHFISFAEWLPSSISACEWKQAPAAEPASFCFLQSYTPGPATLPWQCHFSKHKTHRASPASAHFWTWGCGNSLDSFLIRRVCDRLGAYYITVLKSENSNLNHETQTQFPAGACGFFWKTHRLSFPALPGVWLWITFIGMLSHYWRAGKPSGFCNLAANALLPAASPSTSKLLKLLNSHLLAWEFGTWFRWNHVTNGYFSILIALGS